MEGGEYGSARIAMDLVAGKLIAVARAGRAPTASGGGGVMMGLIPDELTNGKARIAASQVGVEDMGVHVRYQTHRAAVVVESDWSVVASQPAVRRARPIPIRAGRNGC